jgi:hypothetical protein
VVTPLAMELIRQVLRWIGVYLMTIGLPGELGALFNDPATASLVAGGISYAIAETGWLAAKVKGPK